MSRRVSGYGRAVQRALSSLASVFADPAAPSASAALDALRARWRELSAPEQEALTPVARLAAERVQVAREPDRDPDGYWAHLVASEASVEAEAGAPPAPAAPAAPRRRRPLGDVTPEGLLPLLGLTAFRPGQREAVQAALDGARRARGDADRRRQVALLPAPGARGRRARRSSSRR